MVELALQAMILALNLMLWSDSDRRVDGGVFVTYCKIRGVAYGAFIDNKISRFEKRML
jgi:hypothetical protein